MTTPHRPAEETEYVWAKVEIYDMIPDHPALPAIARWINDTPDALKWLRGIATCAAITWHDEECVNAAQSLLTALEEL